MVSLCKKIAEWPFFQRFIIGVILFAGLVVGLETSPEYVAKYGNIFHYLDVTILTIFVLEILIKLIAEYPRPQKFFKDPWNVFDFLIVAAAFLPIGAEYITVLRLLRLLRVLRLLKALPQLRILVTALLKSIPSMGYVGMFLFILFYIYGVAATFLFRVNDPVHFGTLPLSLLSLFRTVTLEDWTDIMYIQMYGCDNFGYWDHPELCTNPEYFPLFSPIFFVSFVMFGTMIVLNLFIGVIMNGMDEARKEQETDNILLDTTPTPEEQWKRLEAEMKELEHKIGAVREAMSQQIAKQIEEGRSHR